MFLELKITKTLKSSGWKLEKCKLPWKIYYSMCDARRTINLLGFSGLCCELTKITLSFWMYTYVLLTKCEVKMAGYWPSPFFCMFMDQDKVEVHKLAKKERGQYPAILTEQTWSIKDLFYGFRGNFSCGIQRELVSSGQDGSILPTREANRSARFGSSCPLAELVI